MLRMVVRAGRTSARPGGPKQSKPWPWPARIIVLIVFGILLVHWWKFTVFFLVPLTVLTLIAALAQVHSVRSKPSRDPLDEAMADLLGTDRSDR